MTTTNPDLRSIMQTDRRARFGSIVQRQGALAALVALIIFGALRYDGFLGTYNIIELLRYNSMFGLIALGMTFVIMTGGIDLSVGAVVALGSVVAALLSPYGAFVALAGTLGVGLLVGLLNGWIIAYGGIPPFITTLGTLLGARGMALILANNTSIGIDATSGFANINQHGLLLTDTFLLPYPVIILFMAYVIGAVVLNFTGWGRHVLAIGGNEEAARLMGLPVNRIKLSVYALSGTLAAFAGVILAAQNFTGVPTEGVGWELAAITAVVIGGTLLTGGLGSVSTTLVGVLLLGLVFNMLNFENGRGTFSFSAAWQSVIRGVFLLIVIIVQSRLTTRRR